jgi:hypothetical protein
MTTGWPTDSATLWIKKRPAALLEPPGHGITTRTVLAG